MCKKQVYIASPLRGDIEHNLKKAAEYCRFAAEKGYIPICPHLFFTTFFDDNKESERKMGMEFGLDLLKSSDEIWIFGNRISEGMKAEIELAQSLNIPVRDFTEKKKVYLKSGTDNLSDEELEETFSRLFIKEKGRI